MNAPPESVDIHVEQGLLALHWSDGRIVRWTHAALRAACPCAQCRAQRRAGLAVEAGEEMRITDIEPVGAYGLNLVFADGHRRGIYPFQMLAKAAA
jgi:DUF971 family protein